MAYSPVYILLSGLLFDKEYLMLTVFICCAIFGLIVNVFFSLASRSMNLFSAVFRSSLKWFGLTELKIAKKNDLGGSVSTQASGKYFNNSASFFKRSQICLIVRSLIFGGTIFILISDCFKRTFSPERTFVMNGQVIYLFGGR